MHRLLGSLLFACSLATVFAQPAPRTEVNLNSGWRFRLGSAPDAESPATDDAA